MSLRALCLFIKEIEPDGDDKVYFEQLHSRQRLLVQWGAVPMVLLALSSTYAETYHEALLLGIALLNGGPSEVWWKTICLSACRVLRS